MIDKNQNVIHRGDFARTNGTIKGEPFAVGRVISINEQTQKARIKCLDRSGSEFTVFGKAADTEVFMRADGGRPTKDLPVKKAPVQANVKSTVVTEPPKPEAKQLPPVAKNGNGSKR